MGRFKESNREGVREISEHGRETTDMGQEMLQDAEQINSLLEGISLQDDEDVQAIRETSISYDSSFDGAFDENVESAAQEIEGQGAEIKSNIEGELENVHSGISNLEQAAGVTEIGRAAAEGGRASLEGSASEYEGIISDSDAVVSETRQRVDALKSSLSSVFG